MQLKAVSRLNRHPDNLACLYGLNFYVIMNDEDKKRYDETTRQMEQMYKDGMSMAKIGKEFAMTRQGIRHRLMVAEISRRKNKYQQIDRAKLEKLYCRERLQISRIADFFSVSQPIIQRALIYHKIPPRNPLGKRGFMREFLKQLKPNEYLKI